MPNTRRMGYLLAACVGGGLLAATAWNPAPPPRFRGVSGRDVPRRLSGWGSGQDDAVAPEVRAALPSADLLSRTYGQGVDAVSFVLIGGTDRTALHDPRACLIGAGMQIENDHAERLPGTDVEARACHAVGAGGAGADMLYFYVVDGKVVSEVTQIRAAMLWSALLGRRGTPTYFLRFTRPLDSGPQSGEEHARLGRFAAQMWAALSPKIGTRSHANLYNGNTAKEP